MVKLELTKYENVLVPSLFPKAHGRKHFRLVRCTNLDTAVEGGALVAVERGGGGRMVAEVVGAFNQVTERMKMSVLSTGSSQLLFEVLKLSIPILHSLPFPPNGRSPLSKALSLALILADLQVAFFASFPAYSLLYMAVLLSLMPLQMDAEVISAGILRHVFNAGAISIREVRDRIGSSTAHLLYETLRLNNIHPTVDVLDDESASAFRKFCLAYYDIRAIVIDLALNLDSMRHLESFPRYKQQLLALQVMFIQAPMAHAIGANWLSLELEDHAFHYLFPFSYLYVDTWLRSHESFCRPLIDLYTQQLRESLKSDSLLASIVEDVSIYGRFKSRYSTMKKLLRDGRKPEEINDVLGLRVVLKPKSGDPSDMGETACYRTREIIQSLWNEIPHRSKDYIANPKDNGYRSLHMAVDVTQDGMDRRPLMEIQIRSTAMEMRAVGGMASHSLYKGGLTDPEEANRLKSIMMAAAEVAAVRLRDFSPSNQTHMNQNDRIFGLLDKNGDGKISIEELTEVMEDLGAPKEDAREMMLLLDSNCDGSLSSEEFDIFQKQIKFMRKLGDKDNEFKALLNEKLKTTEQTGLIQVYSKELGNRLSAA